VEEGGRRFVRHHIFDFSSTLGASARRPDLARSQSGHLFTWGSSIAHFFTFGLTASDWMRVRYPSLPGVGRFESKLFDPAVWVPESPNPAFEAAGAEDDFWMARHIASLRDGDIEAAVAAGEHSDTRSAAYIADCLKQRRDKIARYAFGRILPLDNFRVQGGVLAWDDLLSRYGYGSAGSLVTEWSRFDNASGAKEPAGRTAALPDAMRDGYWVAEIRGEKANPSRRVAVYLRRKGNRTEIVGKQYPDR
jgi:hypothetical protein